MVDELSQDLIRRLEAAAARLKSGEKFSVILAVEDKSQQGALIAALGSKQVHKVMVEVLVQAIKQEPDVIHLPNRMEVPADQVN